MSVLGLQRGVGRELHISPASGASRLWLEDRQAPGHGQKKKRKGRATRGVMEGRGGEQQGSEVSRPGSKGNV